MSSSFEEKTLARLREKTDRELVDIIDGALERGLNLLRRSTNGDGERHLAAAEQAHAEAVKLLPAVRALDDSGRRRLDRKLADLRSELDDFARHRRSGRAEGRPHAINC